MNRFELSTGEVVELDVKWTFITECIGRDGKRGMASKHRTAAAAQKFLDKEAAKYGMTPVSVIAAS